MCLDDANRFFVVVAVDEGIKELLEICEASTVVLSGLYQLSLQVFILHLAKRIRVLSDMNDLLCRIDWKG